MARKKADEAAAEAPKVQEPTPELTPPEPTTTPNGAEGAVGERNKKPLVAALWREAPDSSAKDIAEAFAAKYGTTVSLPTVGNAKPADLRRPRGTRGAAGTSEASEDNGEITIIDLLRVKELADKEGGLDGLAELVGKVEKLASEVGGVTRLKKALDALGKLRG